MPSQHATLSRSILDEYLETTIRFDGFSVPREAVPDEDGPTVAVGPATIAALAACSRPPATPDYATSRATPRAIAGSASPSSRPARPSARPVSTPAVARAARGVASRRGDAFGEDPAMRRAVIGIWTVAALLFATLGVLVR